VGNFVIRLGMSYVARPQFDRNRRYGFKLGIWRKEIGDNFISVTKVSTNGRMYAISIVWNVLQVSDWGK